MDVEELEHRLSKPSPAAIEALRGIGGDLLVLGAGGKMGPSLARMTRRALDAAGSRADVIAVSRFGDTEARQALERHGVRIVACDLLDPVAVDRLPEAGALLFLAGAKFGTAGDPARTWAVNAWLPGLIAARYRGVPTVVFSSGNVYPFVPVASGGATEDTEPAPVGEYAWSVLARERIFAHFARQAETPLTILRLNYAAELRYGVPLDIALEVYRGKSIDLTMGYFNAIWQADANAMALASLAMAAGPPAVVNVTGLETLSVRELARRFGKAFGVEPVFEGMEADTALLSDASRAHESLGPVEVSIDRLVEWIADWVAGGGATLDKPTHYDVRDGTY